MPGALHGPPVPDMQGSGRRLGVFAAYVCGGEGRQLRRHNKAAKGRAQSRVCVAPPVSGKDSGLPASGALRV